MSEITLIQWTAKRKAYLLEKPESIAAINIFAVWWDERVRQSDMPTMQHEQWNGHFLEYLLHFYLPNMEMK